MNEWAKNQADAAKEYLYSLVGSKDIGKVKDAIAALTHQEPEPHVFEGGPEDGLCARRGCARMRGNSIHKLADPTPSIPESWDLITAGGGRTWQRRGNGRWWPLDGRGVGNLTTAEILALGPVRRAVVVTLPEAWLSPVNIGGRLARSLGSDAGTLREYAAELLAAALHAEEGNV